MDFNDWIKQYIGPVITGKITVSKQQMGLHNSELMTLKPVIRCYPNGKLELVSTFAYWKDKFTWECCEDYISRINQTIL
jgi:hypothetical protein